MKPCDFTTVLQLNGEGYLISTHPLSRRLEILESQVALKFKETIWAEPYRSAQYDRGLEVFQYVLDNQPTVDLLHCN